MRTTTASRRQLLSIAAILFAVSTAAITWTIFVPLVVVHLERMQASAFVTGVVASIWALPILVLGPVYPRLIARLGAVPALTAGMAVSAAVILLFPLFRNVWAWIALSIVSGAAQGHLWILMEAWINQVASDGIRGRVTALYSALPAGASTLGPVILLWVGFEGMLPFVVAAAFLVLAVVPLYLIRDIEPATRSAAVPALRRLLLPTAGLLVVAFIAGVFEDGAVGLLPVFALSHGLREDLAVTLVTVFLLGRFALIYPIGHLADRFDRKAVLLVTSTLTLACLVLMPLAVANEPLLLALVFLCGSVSGAFYSLGLALLGGRFQTHALTAANTLFIVAHSLGLVIGFPATGLAMDAWGPQGFTYALSAGVLAVILVTLLGRAGGAAASRAGGQ
jgi:MFS family permease